MVVPSVNIGAQMRTGGQAAYGGNQNQNYQGAGGVGAGGAGAFDGIFSLMQAQLMMQSQNPMYAMLVIAVLSTFMPLVRSMLQMVVDYFTSILKARADRLEQVLRAKQQAPTTITDPITKEIKIVHSITYSRQYTLGGGGGGGGAGGGAQGNTAAKVGDFTTADAILDVILRQPNAEQIVVVADLEMLRNTKEIPILTNEPMDLVFQLQQSNRDEHGDLRQITFTVSSTAVTTEHIRAWARKTTEAFVEARKNEIGDREYFFDQVTDDQRMQGQTVFTMTPFISNRTLENVFFDQDKVVRHRVRFFRENRAWYDKRGIPYTLGFLFFSAPGCGKTSTVKAIANELKRHVFNLNLSAIKTKRQLKKLFYDSNVEVMTSTQSRNVKTISIPIDRRLYVIEDMDCLDGENEFLMRRSDVEKNRATIAAEREARDKQRSESRDRRVTGYADGDDIRGDLDLATILNVLDGTLETPGRVILFTSNHPEKLDHALVRPGRIDGMIEFGLASHDIVKRMYENFYDEPIDEELLLQVKSMTWTPAEVSQVFFRNFDEPDEGLRYLIEHSPKDDFRRFETDTTAAAAPATAAPKPSLYPALANDAGAPVNALPSFLAAAAATTMPDAVRSRIGPLLQQASDAAAQSMAEAAQWQQETLGLTQQRQRDIEYNAWKTKGGPMTEGAGIVLQERNMAARLSGYNGPDAMTPTQLAEIERDANRERVLMPMSDSMPLPRGSQKNYRNPDGTPVADGPDFGSLFLDGGGNNGGQAAPDFMPAGAASGSSRGGMAYASLDQL